MSEISRRDFLSSSALLAIGGGLCASTFNIEALAAAPKTQRTVADILHMSDVQIAKESVVVQSAHRVIVEAAKQIRDNSLRSTVLAILDNPAPTIAKNNEKDILSRLQKENLIDTARKEVFPPVKNPEQSPQPFWSAPGSGYASHHAYPGGLVTHTALNVVSAQALVKNYMDVNGLTLDYDAAVGGEILHDLHKPWVFAWQDDHSCRKEQLLAATGEHHVLSIAESIARKVPAQVVVAQACAHEHPATPAGEKLVVGWIKAASIMPALIPSKLVCSTSPAIPCLYRAASKDGSCTWLIMTLLSQRRPAVGLPPLSRNLPKKTTDCPTYSNLIHLETTSWPISQLCACTAFSRVRARKLLQMKLPAL